MPDIDESQLIDASLQGNSAAFGELVQIHQHRLFNAMANFCGNATEAEDVVQEAFVQAYLKLAKFQQNSQFYTWLYRIAFNAAISRKRRKRVEASVDKNREEAGLEPVDGGDAPGDQMMRDEQAALVHKALAMLSDGHREILVLREMDGCDYEQIAELLDINVGTVRSRLHRARMQLKERLVELG
ncbi:MAG: sigma-70 family RNA polymerase sigma factor [Planctomycetes bacterium]|nr:sigma-70 family RNA polymerase sigma factor [Planctomycetota bacterium]